MDTPDTALRGQNTTAGGRLGSGANYGQRHANLPVRRLSSRSQNSCPDFGRSLPLSSQTS